MPQTDYNAWGHRTAFMWFLHAVVPLIYIIGILGVAVPPRRPLPPNTKKTPGSA